MTMLLLGRGRISVIKGKGDIIPGGNHKTTIIIKFRATLFAERNRKRGLRWVAKRGSPHHPGMT